MAPRSAVATVEKVALGRPPTMADLEALPPHVKGEILDGVLYTQARPRRRHQGLLGAIHDDLRAPFQRARGGPGGWWILPEPGIELPQSPEFSPDLAGWRRETLPDHDPDEPLTTVPDWLCEILSPSNRGYDLLVKRRFYARIGVPYLWYVDPLARTLTASQLEGGRWLELGVYGEDEQPRIAPFDAIELALAEWWEGLRPSVPGGVCAAQPGARSAVAGAAGPRAPPEPVL